MRSRPSLSVLVGICAAAIAPFVPIATAQAGQGGGVKNTPVHHVHHTRTVARHTVVTVHQARVRKVAVRHEVIVRHERPVVLHQPTVIVEGRAVEAVISAVPPGDWAPYYHGALNALTAANEALHANASNAQVRADLTEALRQLNGSSDHRKYRVKRQDAIDCTTNLLRLLESGTPTPEADRLTQQAIADVQVCLSLVDRH